MFSKRWFDALRTQFSIAAFSNETGSQIVEFGLVILPLMGVLFLIMDVAWICFAQASLQHAVQVGVRSAVTGYMPSGFSGQDAYVKWVVEHNSMGFVAGPSGLNQISICYLDASTLPAVPSPSNVPKCLTGTGSNAGGNVIEVSVANVAVSALGPIWRESSAHLLLNANSSDVMESSPNGIPPTR